MWDKVSLLLLPLLAAVFFRNTISVLFGEAITLILIAGLLFCAMALYLLNRLYGKTGNKSSVGEAYVCYLLLLVLFSPLLTNQFEAVFDSYLVALIGFLNLGALIVFWMYLFEWVKYSRVKILVTYLFVLLAGANAVGAIVQYYVSLDLFGLIKHVNYTREDAYLNEGFTKRAVSFVAAPQSLSLLLAFGFALTLSIRNLVYRHLLQGIFILAGTLTLSKAFVVFLIVFCLVKVVRFNAGLVVGVVLMSMGLSALVILSPELGRVGQLFYYIGNLQEYPAYSIWRDSILISNNPVNFLFGNGLGLFSRGGQSLVGYSIHEGSTESYFIQVYVECGVVGLAFLLFLIALSSMKLALANQKTLLGCLLGFSAVGLFTPALYGLVCGLAFYFCIFSGLAIRKRGV